MPIRKDSPNRSETFGRLLSGAINSIATYEGRTAPVVEEELGQQLSLSGKTIQRYKAGYLPPEHETIKVLAEAAVGRGYLGREWLERFLHAARYPFAEKLLDQLTPIGPARSRPPRVYENLPAPTYNQFVMRPQAFAEVVDGLQQRSAVVLIVGLGGNGKTSLAREVAARCLQATGDMPRFDAVVWVSDKDRPGTTNLSVVLDEIARTLDYPGFTQFEHEEKQREVEQLLRRQRVLLVIDNFETITDGALLTWLLRLPEPSKVLITSREKHRGLWSSWLAELRGMRDLEAQSLIHQRLRMLQLDKLVKNVAEFEPLVAVTGGNPKAIEIALGLIKHERRPLQQVVDDLHAARGALFDDLFTRAWALLDEAARRVLLVMTFFPDSASGTALSATADVQGFAFDRAVERLNDLALFDIQQEDLNSPPRYALHPLVRAFAAIKLEDQTEFAAGARERWVEWYVQVTAEVGYCPDDLNKLKSLDPEQETIFTIIQWTFQEQWYSKTLKITSNIGFYYHVRGLWDKKFTNEQLRMKCASKLGNVVDESTAVSYLVQLLSKQNNHEDAAKFLPRLEEIEQSETLPISALCTLRQTLAIFSLTNRDINTAQARWQKILDISRRVSIYEYQRTRIWLATCLYLQGYLAEARNMLQELLNLSRQQARARGIMGIQIRLARIALDEGYLAEAAESLAECIVIASQYKDREHLAETQRTYAYYYALRGDILAARAALAEAIDLFERLGMRHELAEAREELADLETRKQSEAAG